MMSIINRYLMNRNNLHAQTKLLHKRVICNSGLSFSAQANEFTYCSPRVNVGPWSSIEIGYPSHVVPLLLSYAEDVDKPTDTVYGYVPTDVVDEIINQNGGIKDQENVG